MPYKKKPKMGYKPKYQPPTSLMNSSGGWNIDWDPDEKWNQSQANKNKLNQQDKVDIDYSMVAEGRIIGTGDTVPSQANIPRGLPERTTIEPTPKAKPATKSKPKPQPSKSLSKMKTISTPSVSGGGSKTVGVREIDTPSNFKTYDLNRLGQMSRKEFGQLKKQKKMSDKGYGSFDSMKDVRQAKRQEKRGERRARKLGS